MPGTLTGAPMAPHTFLLLVGTPWHSHARVYHTITPPPAAHLYARTRMCTHSRACHPCSHPPTSKFTHTHSLTPCQASVPIPTHSQSSQLRRSPHPTPQSPHPARALAHPPLCCSHTCSCTHTHRLSHVHMSPGIQVCKAGAVHTDVPMHARSPAPSGSGVDFPACAAPMSLRLLVTPALHPVCALLRHCSTYVFLRPFAHSHLSHSCPRPLKHDQMKAEVARDRGGGRRKCRWWSGKGVLSCHSRLLGVQSPSRALQTSGLLLPGDKQTPQQVAVSTHLGPAGWRDVSGPARLSPAP